MRISINTACSLVVNELRIAGKDVFSAHDIEQALTRADKGSKCSFENYGGPKGYLTVRGYLNRVKGGWELTESSKANGVIVIKVTPDNAYMIGEITKSVGDAIRKYGKVVETRTEV